MSHMSVAACIVCTYGACLCVLKVYVHNVLVMITIFLRRVVPVGRFSSVRGISSRVSSADLDERRRRMLYHSKQRGCLELDLIMGTFAEKYLPVLGESDVEDYAKILDEETPDLFKWVSGQTAMPNDLQSLPVMQLLLRHINENHPSVFQDQ